MLRFDHMTMIAPTLEEGIAYLEERLGIGLENDATHRDMGTHNRRIRLGDDVYLEVIAVDPGAPSPTPPRWFGLDRAEDVRAAWSSGLRLRGFVARTHDMDTVLARHGLLLGEKRWLDNGYHFAVRPDGDLPMDGALPGVIDLGGKPPTATRLSDQGVRLKDFVLEHPEPSEIQALYEELGIEAAPRVVHAPQMRYRATLDTPSGERTIA